MKTANGRLRFGSIAAMVVVATACADGTTQATPRAGAPETTPSAVVSTSSSSPVGGEVVPDTEDRDSAAETALLALGNGNGDDDGAGFWGSLALHGGYEVERYDDVRTMADSATVVIIGRVGDVVTTRTLTEEGAEEAAVTYSGLEVEVLSVLAGELDPDSGLETIVVESILAPAGQPLGEAVILFLRHKLDSRQAGSRVGPAPPGEADKYRLVNSQGLFMESTTGVRNPIVEALRAASSQVAEGLEPSTEELANNELRTPIADEVRQMTIQQVVTLIRG